MNNVFIQIGFEESPSTHYITHKTIYMYFLNNSHDFKGQSFATNLVVA